MNHSSSLSIPGLQGVFSGRVIAPGDADYDEARAIFGGGFNGHPAVIVRAADAADVVKVVKLARETGLPLAVRSGGHSGAGHSTTEGGIVLDLRDLKSLDIDTDRRSAWAGAGLTAGEYSAGSARTAWQQDSGTQALSASAASRSAVVLDISPESTGSPSTAFSAPKSSRRQEKSST